MINAIPIGRNNILLIPLNIIKIIPLTTKSIAAVLYDCELLEDLPLIVKVFYLITNITTSLILIYIGVNNFKRMNCSLVNWCRY